MSSERFHKAAKDGLLEVLKEATRKDANSKDDDSMTPVLWAAFEGHLEALRLLCGRGGDPDKCDQFGNTALHLAAAKGQLRCVDFLVKFGVNIYALDIDKHSAKDLAAINNRDEILRYLDAATASFEATDRKKAKAMKELAEKNCEKRIKEYMKRQQKQDQDQQKETKSHPANAANGKSGKMLSTLKQKIWSSQGNLHKISKENSPSASSAGVKFSELVQTGSTGGSSVGGGSVASRKGHTCSKAKTFGQDSGFKIGEMEPDGRRTITSLSGVQRDSEVLYVGTFSSNEENCKRGKINGLFENDEGGNSETETSNQKSAFGTLSRSFSQPDILGDNEASDTLRPEINMQRPSGLFDRPMLGSIAFRRSVTAALSQLNTDVYSGLEENTNNTQPSTRSSSMCSKARSAKQRSFLNLTDSDSDGADGFSDDDDQDVAGGPIQRFLTVWGLEEYLHIFQKQQIDLDTLLLLTEADLKSLGLPLGPFRKLSFAIQERKNALSNPGPIRDSHL
ncbi:pre-mRNA splicing regulator USH1G [Stomoxys calcitrans]|uniref:pre-mRNA splicing regulator USH1G n=1 Tax=Stomoxys calcitrans TaxID=35570 RepID=UPI0027E26891|nr:pre-mRNA splicing regulator USH1G [Stomoxys calcitrans]XP_059225292.1 pre-mRNA splicing regulator USH1G [Stomoxys calcitrans]XP_059225293.1 pre-mRNA splicing regulator USH1G [Stomoxys calcitrans]